MKKKIMKLVITFILSLMLGYNISRAIVLNSVWKLIIGLFLIIVLAVYLSKDEL